MFHQLAERREGGGKKEGREGRKEGGREGGGERDGGGRREVKITGYAVHVRMSDFTNIPLLV